MVVDEGGEREEIKEIGEEAPDVGVAVLAQALVVEAVHLRDLPRLVVPANQRYAVWVADFEAEEEQEGFERVEAAVDEVACGGITTIRTGPSEELDGRKTYR